jgi:hypothetical protein
VSPPVAWFFQVMCTAPHGAVCPYLSSTPRSLGGHQAACCSRRRKGHRRLHGYLNPRALAQTPRLRTTAHWIHPASTLKLPVGVSIIVPAAGHAPTGCNPGYEVGLRSALLRMQPASSRPQPYSARVALTCRSDRQIIGLNLQRSSTARKCYPAAGMYLMNVYSAVKVPRERKSLYR